MNREHQEPLVALCRALAEIEPAALPPPAVAELVVQLTEVVSAAQAALVRAIGAAAGSRGAAADVPAAIAGPPPVLGWLARRARLTWAASAALLVAARALARLPVLAGAFRHGEVGLDHVLAVTVPLTSSPRLIALSGPAEVELTALARRADPAAVRTAVDHWLREADPGGVARDAAAARHARSLSLLPVPAAGDPGGRVTIAGTVPVDDARTLLDALRLAAPTTAGPGDSRSPAQRRADALLTVARCYSATARLARSE